MTFNTEAQYWVHLLTHHPDAVQPIRDVMNVIKVKYLVQEGEGQQEVRYGFGDGSSIALFYELHELARWQFLYAEVANG